jgi:hypothetical protein
MMNKSKILACFVILLLVPSVAMPQTAKQQKSLFDTYVRQGNRPLYEVASSPTLVTETPKTETVKEGPNTEKIGAAAGSAAPDTDTKPATDTKSAAGPAAPKPIEAEIEELKARLADLETKLSESEAAASEAAASAAAASAAAAAARAQAEKVPSIPEAFQEPPAAPPVDKDTPFAYGDQTWFNGTPRNGPVFDTKFFTPEVRFDTHFMEDFNQPKDHTMGGATESFRSGEIQVEQISFGGDFHWNNVRGRVLTMNGLFATTTPRNDGSPGNGQWDVRGAYKYVSEAWGGYHFDVNHGFNVDAGIFVSYIGLFSYYNFDNWTYQPSFVSSNTPWFFNGIRLQWFPTQKLKIEPWIINGWQSYNKTNGHIGLGGQILWIPKDWLRLVFNNYGNGEDELGIPGRSRIHTDDSIELRYFNKPMNKGISKMGFTITGDLGCEYGANATCMHQKPYDPVTRTGGPKQTFAGWMAYNRVWFGQDKYAVTLGGGRMNNPGRYLTLLPPINGADAISGSPYFPAGPSLQSHMYDSSLNLQWMPRDHVTWWLEGVYRHADVPYWTGRGGITPPGGNNGSPGQFACMSGAASGATDLPTATTSCAPQGGVWFPDMRRGQATLSAGVMVKF